MKIFGIEFGSKRKRRRRTNRRAFQAAKTDRLFANWTATNQSADAELYAALRTLRARSRDLAVNDDYLKRFLEMVKTNTVGPRGVSMQMRARSENGDLDTQANELIENAWRDWSRFGVPTVDGRLSWIDAQNLFTENAARDGETLVRMVEGWPHNVYGFALQFIDADYLDETHNEVLGGGREIRLGIEYNEWNRAEAYHVLNRHPGAFSQGGVGAKRKRIPAREIIHGFVPHRSEQGRGYPWAAQSLRRLKMLAGYEEAELVAARLGASKMGWYVEPEGTGLRGDEEDLDGFSAVDRAEPGTFDRLPFGTEFKEWNPDHPTSAFEGFSMGVLRGAASGLNVSYVGLASDLRGVSYSSIRQGALDERDYWRVLQTWLVEHFVARVFARWLWTALTTGAVALPPRKYKKFHTPVWRPRGWSWIDPLKEVKANQLAVKSYLKSLQMAIGEQGIDLEDILQDNQTAQELADKYSVELPIDEE